MKKFLSLGILLALLALPMMAGAQGGLDARVLMWESTPEPLGTLQLRTLAGVEQAYGSGVVTRCGQDYWSSGGQSVAVYTTEDADEGRIDLYPLAGGEPVALGPSHRMACAGPLSFQFSPNGQRVGYIDWKIDYGQEIQLLPFQWGYLHLMDPNTGDELANFERTVGFMLYDDGALMMRVFPDAKENGEEADLVWWDGSARRTLVTLPVVVPEVGEKDPEPECGITQAQPVRIGDTAYVLVGQRCDMKTSINNSWRVYSVPMAGGAATEIVKQDMGNIGFFSGAFSTLAFPTLDGSGMLIGLPSGLSANTVHLYWVTPDGTVAPVAEGMHFYSDRFGNQLTEGRNFQLSFNGGAIAFVSTQTANVSADEMALWVMDMTTAGGQPVLVDQQSQGERIFQYLWAGNNTLYFISGNLESSSISSSTVAGGSTRIERGRFYRMAISYNGEKIVGAEYWENPERQGQDLYKLTLLDTNGSVVEFAKGTELQNEFLPLALQ